MKDDFTRAELEWGKRRAIELHARGMSPKEAAREALFELEDRVRRKRLRERQRQLADAPAFAGLRASIGDLLTHKRRNG